MRTRPLTRSLPAPQSCSRRRFLFAAGAGALAPTLLGSIANAAPAGSARPDSGSAPLRFIGVFMPHGCAYELWKPACRIRFLALIVCAMALNPYCYATL
jgi:hypothetical protein